MARLLGFLLAALSLFAGAPRRVVSQTVGTDELLLALADPDQIASLSNFARDPRYSPVAREAARFPALRASDPESILAHKPDLVLVASFTRAETRLLLQRARVPLLCFDRMESFQDLCEDARRLGAALGHPDRAEALIRQWRQREQALRARLAGVRPTRVLAAAVYPFSAGKNTSFQDICDHAGAVNTAAEAGLDGHQPTPGEKVLTWNVEVLVASGDDGENAQSRLREIPPYKFMPALRQGRLVMMPGPLMAATGPHRLDAYEFLAKALHPERFR